MNNLIVGLTGQTGAGKSTVAGFALAMGCRIIDCDLVAREALSPGSDCLKRLSELFGSDIIDENGCCRRSLLAERAFSDKKKTELLNSVTHPWIIRRSQEYIEKYSMDFDGVIILDAPLLYESGGDILCSKVIAVTAPLDVRLERIMNRDDSYMSFSTMLCYSKHHQNLIEKIDLDYILTETDSPYLAMTKEERNEPANVVNAVHKIAEIKDIDVSTVDEITTNNARKIFKI